MPVGLCAALRWVSKAFDFEQGFCVLDFAGDRLQLNGRLPEGFGDDTHHPSLTHLNITLSILGTKRKYENYDQNARLWIFNSR